MLLCISLAYIVVKVVDCERKNFNEPLHNENSFAFQRHSSFHQQTFHPHSNECEPTIPIIQSVKEEGNSMKPALNSVHKF